MEEYEHLRIPLEVIKHATNNFDDENFIAEGGFGKVFRGDFILSEVESMGAVKVLDRSKDQADVSFWREIMLLSEYKHKNLISLLGFCDESAKRIIVYEYAANKSLDLHLQDPNLTWIQRLKICLGAARGLEYLHNPQGTQQRVLHRDIKSANILLDENWDAKIADFGLSKYGPANQEHTFLFSDAKGTLGYCDPVYIETMVLTKESDVYSFGVVLFEVLCSRACVDFTYEDERRSLTILVKKCYEKQTLDTIIDVNLREQIEQRAFDTFVTLAFQCLNGDHTQRPSMDLVVSTLETALEYQHTFLPPPPPSPPKIYQVDPLRRALCEMILQKINIPPSDIINAILALDSSDLNLDQVVDLFRICPIEEEIELIQGFTGNKEMLGKCEQFFLECAKISRIQSKLHTLVFKMEFSNQVNSLYELLNTISQTSLEIRNSTKLVEIMQTILKMMNKLNVSSARGSALGFKLDSLEQLYSTRAANNKRTLMHFLCKVVAEQTPDLLDFDKDLVHLEAASKISLRSMAEEMQAISMGLKKVENIIISLNYDDGENAQYREALKSFQDSSKAQFEKLVSLYGEAGRNADALALYFGEDPSRYPWEKVIQCLSNFVMRFKEAHVENKEWADDERKKLSN